jgi:SHS family lactate transporter-like MFS transporter
MFRAFRALTWPQRHAFAACFLGWSLDAFDYFLLVFCVPAISGEFHAKTSAVAEALFLTLAFRPVGAFLFGWLADRYGRKRTLMLNIACYSVLELACAFAPTLPALLVLRALFGIAMGGEWGVGAALAFETLPKENRGFFSGILQEGYAIGYLVAAAAYGLLFRPLAGMEWAGHVVGWRGLFVIGALPAVLIVYIGSRVEESPVWLAGRGRADVPRAPGLGFLESVRRYGGTFLFLVLLMTGFNALSHGTQDLYPTFLQKDHGASPAVTGSIGILYNIGALFGGIVFGSLSERFGRKRAIISAALLTVPIIPLYALSHSLAMLALGAFLMQFMVQGAWGVVPAYLSELSPGPVRATFPGLAYQLGNLITSRNGVAQALIAEKIGSFGPVLAVTVLLCSCLLVVVTSLGRESRGADLSAST